MSRMFDNYNKDYKVIPDNELKYIKKRPEFKDSIRIGADNIQSFNIPYPREDIEDIIIVYKQGTEEILYKYLFDLDFEIEEENWCYCTYLITVDESKLFNNYNRDVNVQLKLVKTDGETELSRIYPIKILPSLFEED